MSKIAEPPLIGRCDMSMEEIACIILVHQLSYSPFLDWVFCRYWESMDCCHFCSFRWAVKFLCHKRRPSSRRPPQLSYFSNSICWRSYLRRCLTWPPANCYRRFLAFLPRYHSLRRSSHPRSPHLHLSSIWSPRRPPAALLKSSSYLFHSLELVGTLLRQSRCQKTTSWWSTPWKLSNRSQTRKWFVRTRMAVALKLRIAGLRGSGRFVC